MVTGNIEGNLGTRVAGPDDEDSALTQLVAVAVLGRMELDDGVVELSREGRDARVLIGTGSHHDVVGKEPVIARGHHETVPAVRQPVHLDPGSNRKPEPLGVRLEIIGDLILGGVRRSGAGKGHAGQPAIGGGGE